MDGMTLPAGVVPMTLTLAVPAEHREAIRAAIENATDGDPVPVRLIGSTDDPKGDLLGEEVERLLRDNADLTRERDAALRQLELAREHRDLATRQRDEAERQRDQARAQCKEAIRAHGRLLDAAAEAGRVVVDAVGTVRIDAPTVRVEGAIVGATLAPPGWENGSNVR